MKLLVQQLKFIVILGPAYSNHRIESVYVMNCRCAESDFGRNVICR